MSTLCNELKRLTGDMTITDRLINEFPDRVFEMVNKRSTDREFPELPFDYAARNGYLEVVKWLHRIGKDKCSERSVSWTASSGHVKVLKHLHQEHLGDWTPYAMEHAAFDGQFETVKFLHQKRVGCTSRAIDNAARAGHYEIVKFLCCRYPHLIDGEAIHYAAMTGRPMIVEYLYNNHRSRCGDMIPIVDVAIREGQLEVLKFFAAHGETMYDSYALDDAKRRGYHDVVKYVETHMTKR